MEPVQRAQLNSLIRQDVDWQALIPLAIMHGVMPLLYSNLKQVCPNAVPAEPMAQLKARFMANAEKNVSLTGELLRILKLFSADNIPAVPFKGPAQAAAVYGNLAFRQFGDLDILVHKEDAFRTRTLLEKRGYRFQAELSDAHELDYLQSQNHHHFCLSRNDGRATVELHWEVAPRHFAPAIKVEELWRRVEPALLAGQPITGFAAPDTILLLCIHNAKHGWNRLEYICAIAEFLQLGLPINWEEVLLQARQWRCLRMVLLGFQLAYIVLGMRLPEPVQAEINKTPAILPLAEQTRSRLFGEINASPGLIYSIIHRMRVQDRRLDRIRYGWSIIFSPTSIEWQELPLPGFLSFLYPLLRLLRLALKYSLRFLNPLIKKISLKSMNLKYINNLKSEPRS